MRPFGVNLAFGANFPQASDAPIARQLRRFGVNMVRLHHTSPDRTTSDARSLNPVSVARLSQAEVQFL